MKTLASSLALCSILLVSGTAQAALESRLGGQAVYDTDLNITWVSDGNLLWTLGYQQPGSNGYNFTWLEATQLVGNLTYGGYSDWRLPNKNEIYSRMDASQTDPISWLIPLPPSV